MEGKYEQVSGHVGSYASICTARRRAGLPAFPGSDLSGAHVFPPLPGCDLTGAHVFPPLPPHLGDPVVHPPVGEDGRVVVLEDLEVPG